ncbi:MAG: cupin domain-containing protein [Proteobacteria bacterium]|nr:cupin domain-containing protein [Pseudomonadota bacterium]
MTSENTKVPLAIKAEDAPLRTKPSNYPEPFFSRMAKREKRPLGDIFGLKNFGVNLTRLLPGGESALLHRHSKQDEFVYILDGTPTLVTDTGEIDMEPGMCAGFPAAGIAHHLVNRTTRDVVYLEIGDRTPGDEGSYPSNDLKASLGPDGKWVFTRKDGSGGGAPSDRSEGEYEG